jgi:hypothetical protein
VALFDQRTVRNLQVTWRIDDVSVNGTTGTVRVNGTHQFILQGKACRLPVSMNLRVANASNAWRIAGVQQLGPEPKCQ